MQEFYKKALLALIFLIVADALVAAFFIHQSYLSLSLLAPPKGPDRWQYIGNVDSWQGGSSTVRIAAPGGEKLRFDFRLTDKAQFPFVAAELWRRDGKNQLAQMDLSKYSSISFNAKCAPANVITFALLVFDEKISKAGDFLTYRNPQTYFACNDKGVHMSLDLARLSIPDWWFYSQKRDISGQAFKLDKVSKITFGTNAQSPRNVDSQVEISELTLRGRDYRYITALGIVLFASLSAFGWWFFRAHSRALIASLDTRMEEDLPLVAYRQLTMEPFKDKEKASILRFIATSYTDTELDLQSVVNGTGANRNKINEVLKTELGMTFTRYLNKLRLTEAARLLTEKRNATVSEIAYLVGYGHVTYFNQLFKKEYGCTPKEFRSLATEKADDLNSSQD